MNVLENIPYNDEKMGMRKVVDTQHLLVMQIALRPGQSVPQHSANSHVHLLVMQGNLNVTLDGADNHVTEGDIVPVDYRTRMIITNAGNDNAAFLVLKTPHPSEIEKENVRR